MMRFYQLNWPVMVVLIMAICFIAVVHGNPATTQPGDPDFAGKALVIYVDDEVVRGFDCAGRHTSAWGAILRGGRGGEDRSST